MRRRPSLVARPLGIGAGLLALACTASGCAIVPGTTYSGEGTYYLTADGTGNCSFDVMSGHAFAAMNTTDYEESRLCGGWVTVTGPRGTTTVQIVDRCPECAPGDIDLSPGAFDAIALRSQGRVPITWNLHSGSATMGNLQVKVKEGSNQWWLALQVRNHRNLIQSMEVRVGSTWVPMERQQYNYFLYQGDAGPGPYTVRITDNWGEVLTRSGVLMVAGSVQSTSLQFAGH